MAMPVCDGFLAVVLLGLVEPLALGQGLGGDHKKEEEVK